VGLGLGLASRLVLVSELRSVSMSLLASESVSPLALLSELGLVSEWAWVSELRSVSMSLLASESQWELVSVSLMSLPQCKCSSSRSRQCRFLNRASHRWYARR